MTTPRMNIWQVRIDSYAHTRAFDTVALCLRESIRELGIQSDIVHAPEERCIILGAHLLQQIPPGCIVYNLEQITDESPLVNDTYRALLKSNKVWDYSRRNIQQLAKLGIEATHMPIGYHPVLTKIPEGYLQQINCLFYGSINERRKAIIESIEATPVYGIYGKELDVCIASSKIILNCHFYETKLFEIVRCSYLMANRKFILSEPGLDLELEEPFRNGIAFHEAVDWPSAVSYYSKRPDIMEDIAQQGFEIFSDMKQTEYLKNESKSW